MKKIFTAAVLCLSSVGPTYAHSWYPLECCSGYDCAVLTGRPQVEPGGEFRYTTQLGVGVTNPNTKIKESPDNQTHVCIREGKVLCIFFPNSL